MSDLPAVWILPEVLAPTPHRQTDNTVGTPTTARGDSEIFHHDHSIN